ncbi:GNAT family N-acetyltransferase [Ichthyenterobacterium magnum]|uniref:Ribosomal protein S18 acetylase RimI-like enzyme n=1 Tax=Ichthyenterobacterium magnum TaxID=1230530 RepID=A0A420DWY9_9FLAO|nr:GNAT family N-acetyltransferase [Ichthyenterobacterium magnum]RKE98735.1 ribosomal protein S18 acetylase RimI-like enzyme [Ichthyenterobacterium magnum]
MIRKGVNQDIDAILQITNACAKHMIANSVFQWNESYPNKVAFETDVNRGELYVLENNSEIIGCITISTLMDEEYKSVKWLTPNKNNVYIHRLAIHPKHQGKGYAKQLMDYAEALAIENNYSSIRLDTFSKNKRNQKFYELRNYKQLGNIYFPKQSKFPFYCYELIR